MARRTRARGLWRRRGRYRRAVPISRQPGRRLEPIPRPRELDSYVGMWVAVKSGQVIAADGTSRGLAFVLHKMTDAARRGAVIEYVRPSTDGYVVGAG